MGLYHIKRRHITQLTGSVLAVGAGIVAATLAATQPDAHAWTAQQTFNGGITGSANVLDVRNGVNAQQVNIYNTYTDASNYERLAFVWGGNQLYLVTQAAGSGSTRNLNVYASAQLGLGGGSAISWIISAPGHFLPLTTGTHDLGDATHVVRAAYATSHYGTTFGFDVSGATQWYMNSAVIFGYISNGQISKLDSTGFHLVNRGYQFSIGGDTFLASDAANTLAQRNGTNAQAFRVYNTWTDASNYARLAMGYSGTNPFLFTQVAGTGVGDDFLIGTTTAHALAFYTNNTKRWQINQAGDLITPFSDSHDIGDATHAVRKLHAGLIGLVERAADPSDPAEGQSVLWQSDGTGLGDDGDIMMKITAGAVTKTATVVDFSTLP